MTLTRPKSLVLGKDSDVLPQLLRLHAPPNPRILDTTYGKGVMWRGIYDDWKPVRMDADPARGLDILADFATDDLVGDIGVQYVDRHPQGELYDVLVFDPPHITDAGKTSSMRTLYGLGMPGLRANNISAFFAPFLANATRALKPNGIILAKLADQVHAGRHQWQAVDFIVAARAAGLTPCDVIIKADPRAGTLTGNWKTVKHTRNSHCYWIVVRNGPHCEQRTRARDHIDPSMLNPQVVV